ncbi:MAG: DNA damage-inducible protein D [Minisyncoccus archaeiphilus]|uniref:DNA damage-inducible protein D n=1 Tax=Minisyncoccus archaeiphilus TaxID=3238481 RepID=UPI002B062D6E|nr:MAG: DNA damage-inducible protein D [Candidatus Parcubacteria bacterium]
METGQLKLLAQTLDDIRHQNGVEYWYASELYPLLGYVNCKKFEVALNRAKSSCETAGSNIDVNFQNISRKIISENGEEEEINDIKLTRYACYLIAVNGDPKKEQIAFAQAYFITQTRTIELLQQKMSELERLESRKKLKITEKEFSDMIYSRGVDGPGIGQIRDAGDRALYGGKSTEEMKTSLGVKKSTPLADHLPNVTLKAKDLATAMTMESTRSKNLYGKYPIMKEHENSNKGVREALVKSDIYPEKLPASEDIKKIEARHRSELKELQKKQKKELEEKNKKNAP